MLFIIFVRIIVLEIDYCHVYDKGKNSYSQNRVGYD